MKNIITRIFSGEYLFNKTLLNEYKFIIFIFVLIMIYISKNYAMERILLAERANTRELKNIKADYTSKASKLLEISKREEIEKILAVKKSALVKSETAPEVIITGKR